MAPEEDTGQEAVIDLSGNGKGGGGVLENGEIHQAVPEHSHTVHRYKITVRHVRVVGKGYEGVSRDAWW